MKVLIAITRDEIAPRFDLAVEAIIAEVTDGSVPDEPRHLLLSEPSGDEFCTLAVRESVDVVLCGGIDEMHYDYLSWKKISVVDGVIGPYAEALELLANAKLKPDAILPGAANEEDGS
ncbi:MAG: hypothetical protein IBX61_04665 [Thermoleophilia bacterium]|nr:hypothetical protein [Thermoleophilia bacterium]